MTYIYKSVEPRRIAIVGSRHLNDYRRFCLTLRQLHILQPNCTIVSGRSPGGGVDLLAARFARQNSYNLIEYLIDDKLIAQKVSEGLDSRAAFAFAANARNSQIVESADLMLAIACSHSNGTWDSIRKMRVKIEDERVPSKERAQTIRLYNYIWECGIV